MLVEENCSIKGYQLLRTTLTKALLTSKDASTVADSAMNVQGGQKARYMIKHSRKTPQLLLLLLLRCCHKKSLFQRRRLNAGATKKTMSLWRTQLLRQLRSRTKSPPNSATRP
ncbi:hypothetical protein CMV_004778 [Castanea mollissima]|uniref:Uncharacterized protein n=1 Tax=Castanea mollissima TaxID=60419 RepID=A0A8J4RRB9_9ROSI|nr:hypothetical protein CMV_004778 [Castanea mollissima]